MTDRMRPTVHRVRPVCPALGWGWALLGLASALGAESAQFPLRWRWSNPQPHGNNIVDMAYSPALALGVQVAERGQLYTSDDLQTWTARDTGVTNALRGVCFLGSRILVTGEAGVVLHSDTGTTFARGTLTTGPTADWLEGVAATADLAVAVGDSGAVYTSRDGIQWARQNSGVTDWLRGITVAGSRFVAVGESGRILTSANGTNWTQRTSGTSAALNRVVLLGPGRLLAVGEGGVAVASADLGLSWQPVVTGATNTLFTAAASGLDQLVAGDNEVRVMETNVWANELARSNGPPAWTYYAAVGRPGFFLVGGRTGQLVEGYQAAGEPYLWLSSAVSPRVWLFDVFWATNLFVAVGDRATLLTSDNGVDWTSGAVPAAFTNAIWLGVGGTTNLLVAAGSQGSLMISPAGLTNVVVTNTSGQVVTQAVNTLGAVWHGVRPGLSTNDLQGVGFGQGFYVVTGDRGDLLTSPDGTNWTRRVAPTQALLSGVAAGPAGFVATGDDGVILQSSNAVDWAVVASGTTNWLYRVRHLNGRYLVVGQNGTVLVSTNGQAWAARSSGSTEWLNDVTWIGDHYFAVGTAGTVLVSPDTLTWTNIGTITRKALYGLAADTNRLVSVGVEGVILRSTVVPDLTPLNILSYAHSVSTNGATAQDLFLFAGRPDQRFTRDARRDLGTNPWTSGPLLEITDGAGTLYYLETQPASNAPPTRFYRATGVP